MKIHNLDSWSTEELYRHLGNPEQEVISRCDRKALGNEVPPYAVLPAILTKVVEPATADIAIMDFGEASFVTDTRVKWHTPMILQSLEALFHEPVGQPADVWAFACTIYAIFDNANLFDAHAVNKDDVLAEIVDTFGMMPERWWRKWEWRSEFYEEDGTKKIQHLTKEHWSTIRLTNRIEKIRQRSP